MDIKPIPKTEHITKIKHIKYVKYLDNILPDEWKNNYFKEKK